jgi:copper(I)-binding protein
MPLVESLDIPANGTVQVEPGGYHVMINDIANPLSKGSKVHVTLTFANAGEVEFDAPVTGY